jgi:hypothetical protein
LHVSCTYNIFVLPRLQDPHTTILVMQFRTFAVRHAGIKTVYCPVCRYNYKKILAMQQRQAAQQAAQLAKADEEKSLLGKEGYEKGVGSPNTISINAKARD